MSYRSNKNTRKNVIQAITATAIAVAALIIIVSIIGNPTGRKITDSSNTASAGALATTQSVATQHKESEAEKEEKPSETITQTTATTTETETTETEPTKDDKGGMNPKNYEEAIDTEREAEKRVYLTFDDGPSENTSEILDILKKYGIKATFYNIAVSDPELLEMQKKIYDEGHTLGIHSVSHDYEKIYSSFENWKEDVLGEQEKIKNNVGITTKYYRFPGGGSNSKGEKYGASISECAAWLDENGFSYQDWNVDSQDADGKEYTPEKMAENVTDSILDSDGTDFIVLMHDAKPKKTTVKCLPIVIETLQAKGYTFCQVTDNTKAIHHRIRN